MPVRIMRALALCVIMPMTLNYVAYFGFVSQYTVASFSPGGFEAQYGSGIYRYRLLGTAIVMAVRRLMTAKLPHSFNPRMAQFFGTPSADLYNSLFIVNTAFFCATMCALFAISRSDRFEGSQREKATWLLLVAFLIALTQFVVVPYDTLAYAALALSLWVILLAPTPLTTALLLATVALGTLVRETEALSLAAYATLCVMAPRAERRAYLTRLAGMTATFLAVYVSLRLVYGLQTAVIKRIALAGLSRRGWIVGIVLSLTFGWLAMMDGSPGQRRATAIFLLFALPYIVTVFLGGMLFEVRLWVPVFIVLLVFSRIQWNAVPAR